MSIEVVEDVFGLKGEREVTIVTDEDDNGNVQKLILHPWHRYRYTKDENRSVAVTLGWFNSDGYDVGEDKSEGYEITIVDRDDFVEALLAVLPEIKRA
jgi:hypothetical protein